VLVTPMRAMVTSLTGKGQEATFRSDEC